MEKPSMIVVAVDVGTTQINAVMALCTNGIVSPIGTATSMRTGVRRGIIIDRDEAAFGIREAINLLQNKTGHIVGKIYVSIGGQSLKTVDDLYTLDDINANITSEHIQKLASPSYNNPIKETEVIKKIYPQSYVIDGYNETPNPQGYFAHSLSAKNKLLVYNKGYIDALKQSISKAHLKNNVDEVSLLVLGDKMLSDSEKEKGVALVDMGGGTTDLIIYHQKQVHYAVSIPLGGHLITRDIAAELNVSIEMAERLKLEYGSALQCTEEEDRDINIAEEGAAPLTVKLSRLTYITQCRVDEILSILSDQISVSGCRDSLRDGVMLTGRASRMKDCISVLSKQHSLKARIGEFPHEEDFGNKCSALALCLLYKIDSDCSQNIAELETPKPIVKSNTAATNTPKADSHEGGLFSELSN